MAIPIGNDFVERLFSGLKRVWTDDRNRLNMTLIKTEICIKNNFSYSCLDFKDYIKTNNECIKAAKSNAKYRLVKK